MNLRTDMQRYFLIFSIIFLSYLLLINYNPPQVETTSNGILNDSEYSQSMDYDEFVSREDISSEELIVVDYKATSTQKEITLEDEWKISYKRQLEFYQWALRKNNFKVSDVGYFVYCSGIETRKTFKETMKFDVYILDYQGSTEWIEPTIHDIKKTLDNNNVPKSNEECETCSYVESVESIGNNN